MECGVQSLLDTAYFNIVKFLKGNLYFEYTIYRIYFFFIATHASLIILFLYKDLIIHVKQTKEGCTALPIL